MNDTIASALIPNAIQMITIVLLVKKFSIKGEITNTIPSTKNKIVDKEDILVGKNSQR